MSARTSEPLALPPAIEVVAGDWLSSNVVLLFDGARATAIDSGYAKTASRTVERVREALARRGATLRLLVNTHLHSDHCGGNAALARAFGCPIAVPASLLEVVRRWDDAALSFVATGQRCERFDAARGIAPGDTLDIGGETWRAYATPGHDEHSLMFLGTTTRTLVSADALWEHGFGLTFAELRGEPGFDRQLAVFDLIESLDARIVIPGHGAPFVDVAGALARARTRLAAMRANPRRHAKHALKVLVKFLMLDVERIAFDDLLARLANATSMHEAAAMLERDFPTALRHAVDELVAQGQLAREGDCLVEPAGRA